jgi:hypothetical protein
LDIDDETKDGRLQQKSAEELLGTDDPIVHRAFGQNAVVKRDIVRKFGKYRRNCNDDDYGKYDSGDSNGSSMDSETNEKLDVW